MTKPLIKANGCDKHTSLRLAQRVNHVEEHDIDKKVLADSAQIETLTSCLAKMVKLVDTKSVCYTLDLEEDHAGLLKNRFEGLKMLGHFLSTTKQMGIAISVFAQGKIIERFPDCIELLKENGSDVHLHSYSHPLRRKPGDESEIERGKDIYREFFGTNPIGYRFPQGVVLSPDYMHLRRMGFLFDSSIFPTIRLGHFNNLDKPLVPYTVNGIVEMPFSVLSKFLRIPIALSYIKLLSPLHFFLTPRKGLRLIVFDLHLHDLYRISSTMELGTVHRIPYLRHRNEGLAAFLKYHEMLSELGFSSVRIEDVYRRFAAKGES